MMINVVMVSGHANYSHYQTFSYFRSRKSERKSERIIEDGTVWSITLMHPNLFSNHSEFEKKKTIIILTIKW